VTLWISVVLAVVAVAAAVRSTWSPCGLSMLSTLTPLSERAKGHSYRSTATWFILGSTVGGATVGAVMALGAAAVNSLQPAATTLGLLALGAALVAVASDSRVAGVVLPIHRRQVNERWLDHYRQWVYGAGFGWQIGSGVSTYITSAAVYLMIVLGALTTKPVVALAAGTGFGVVRGLAVLMTRHLEDPADLRSFHRRFTAAEPGVHRGVIVVEIVAAAVVAGATWSQLALEVVAVVAVAAGLARVVWGRSASGRAVPSCAVPGRAVSDLAVSSPRVAVGDTGTTSGSSVRPCPSPVAYSVSAVGD
jgi:hypothetical protein